MADFNWTCPYCRHAQSVGDARYSTHFTRISVDGYKKGDVGLGWAAIVCANDECKNLTLRVYAAQTVWNGQQYIRLKQPMIFDQQVLPTGVSKPQPDYIPVGLREDYMEACAIADLSPKAAATLARRCLQGMIRDFCQIKKGTLDQEIKALRIAVEEGRAPRGVTHEAIDAIDHVRTIGNIGAHMEKDIDLIIPVDADEAKVLIQLIEMLFEEWYVAKETRTRRLAQIANIAHEKKIAKLPRSSVEEQLALSPPADETT